MQLDKWQEDALEHDGDLLLCTGRRVGKTEVLARKSVNFIIKKKLPVILISLTEDQAMIILAMALNYAQARYPGFIGKGKDRPKTKEITFVFKNRQKVKLIIRPVGTTGDSVRGFEGGALAVDEASRVPKLFWIAAKPILLTTGGQMWLASTPHGKEGYFWEKFDEAHNKKDPKARFKVIYKTTEEVINERPINTSWTEEQKAGALKILEEDKREMSTIEYGQEYLGLFLDDINQFFPDELIEKCCVLERPAEIVKTGKNYLGCDLARMGGDESTREIVNDPGKYPFKHLESLTRRFQDTTQVEMDILTTAKMWDVRKVGIDAGAGNLGVSILDHLRKTELRHKVIPLNNRQIVIQDKEKKEDKQRILKEDMYHNLRAMMWRGEIQLLKDTDVIASLKSIQIELNSEESAITRTRIHGKYSHIAEGLIRAAWMAEKEKSLNLFAY